MEDHVRFALGPCRVVVPNVSINSFPSLAGRPPAAHVDRASPWRSAFPESHRRGSPGMKLSPFDRRPRPSCAPAEPRSRRSRRRKPVFLSLEERRLLSIDIAIDYSFDTNHFFDTPEKRDLLQLAANVVASGLG